MQAVLYFIIQKLGASGVAVGEVCTLMAWSSENEACSSILDFLHWLNYRVRSAHEKTVAVVSQIYSQRSISLNSQVCTYVCIIMHVCMHLYTIMYVNVCIYVCINKYMGVSLLVVVVGLLLNPSPQKLWTGFLFHNAQPLKIH